MERMGKRGEKMKRIYVILIMTLLTGYFTVTAQTIRFKQIQTDNVCLMQLLENITKVVRNSNWQRDARCHYLSIKEAGIDTLLEIHSYDSPGFYHTISEHKFLGVFIMYDCEFYIDSSLVAFFYDTGKSFKKKYCHKHVEENRLTINDCYYYWLFKKAFCGIELYKSWIMDDFKDWYNLELDSDCFCDYKKISVELIEEESDSFENE